MEIRNCGQTGTKRLLLRRIRPGNENGLSAFLSGRESGYAGAPVLA